MDLQQLALLADPRLVEILICVAAIGILRLINQAG